MNWKLALTGLLALPGSANLLANAEECPPKPIPIRDIKFTDLGGDNLHNYDLVGKARIEDNAPGDIPRALRIDATHSFALLRDIDISPSKMKDVTLAIGFYVESIKPAPAGAPVEGQVNSYGWIMSHDNGGFDRAIFVHDERFGGAGMTVGYIADATPPQVPVKKWIQMVGVWRQGGECALYIDNKKVDYGKPVIGKNNDGLPNLSIGAPQLKQFALSNDNDFWVKDVKIFDYALSDEEVDDLNCHFEDNLEPSIDCGQGGDAVHSCTECVAGDGSASGCAGDCMWRPDVPNCVEKNDSAQNINDDGVSCGDHDAADCSQCAGGASGCSGDCAIVDGECKPNGTEPECIPPSPLAVSTCGSTKYTYNDGGCNNLDTEGLISTSEKRAVRCCSDTEKPRWTKNSGCSVWTESDALDGGCKKGTWCEADKICKENGARLCTSAELLSNCAATSGCWYDHELSWTSEIDVCSKTEKDLVIDSCGTKGGRCGGKTTSLVPATEKRGVRCCSDTKKDSWIKQSQCSVWTQTVGLEGGCQKDKTWCEADKICRDNGGRLCTADELYAGCAHSSGCDYDHKIVWTSGGCSKTEKDQMVDSCGTKGGSCGGKTTSLASVTEKRAVRCCSDTKKDGWIKQSECSVWTQSAGLEGGCQKDKTWCEADFICKKNGGRLCTTDELYAGCAHSSGCNYDHVIAWTSSRSLSGHDEL